MSFLPGMFPGAFYSESATLVSSIAYEGATTSTATAGTITGYSGILPGDLLVLYDYVSSISVPPEVAPSGFAIAASLLNVKFRWTLSYKIADGSEASASLTGMTTGSGSFANKILLCFRPDIPATSAVSADPDATITDANPSAQTVTASGGTAPLIVFGCYASTGAVNPRTMSPAKDGEMSSGTSFYVAWKIYNSSPADVSVDMDDEGNNNMLMSCYIEVA